MFDTSDFIYINESSYRVGINESDIKNLTSALPEGKIKKEYLEASTPAREHPVSSFYISKKLVTVSEYRMFVEATSYVTEAEKEGWAWIWERGWRKKEGISWQRPFGNDSDYDYSGEPDFFPVMQVSWNDAMAYTEWRSSVERKMVRLPAEIEWEIFALKSGIKSMTEPLKDFNGSINNSKEFIDLLRVNIKKSENSLGLLWEWTLDWYNAYSGDKVVKGFGEVYKVLRGGSLLSEEIQKRREFRFRRCPTARSPYYSFRIVFLDN